MNPLGQPSVGIGWRPEIAGLVADLSGLRFCEVIAENLHAHGDEVHLPDDLARLAQRGVTVIPHGIGLSVGGADPLDPTRVAHLAHCALATGSPLVSEHIAFVRAGDTEVGHLLPVPRTAESLDVLTENIKAAMADLPVPLALENVASLFEWPNAEYTESEFLTELVERTGVLLLLDVANIYANARNLRRDPVAELARMPLENVAYCHVAGGREQGGRYHDTHTDRVPDDVLDLVAALEMSLPLMLEIDGDYPPATTILDELDAIADRSGLRRITDGSRWR